MKIKNDSKIIKLVKNSSSITNIIEKLGLFPTGHNYTIIKSNILKLNLNTSHFTKKIFVNNKKTPLENILVENSTFPRHNLKKRLIKEGLLKNECSICGQQPIWNGKPLVMIIDHINGINNDNRIENLRFVCRHCDSQLPTYCGRNLKKKVPLNYCKCGKIIGKNSKMCISCRNDNMKYTPRTRKVENRPNTKELSTLVKKYPFTTIGKMFGVSDNTIRKWCKWENVDYKNIRPKYFRISTQTI